MTADSCQWRSERARGTAGGGGLVAVFHPSPLIPAAGAASTSANDCQTVRDPRRYSSRLTIIHLAPPSLLPRFDAGPADKKIMDRHGSCVSRGRGTRRLVPTLSRTQLRRNLRFFGPWKRSSLGGWIEAEASGN